MSITATSQISQNPTGRRFPFHQGGALLHRTTILCGRPNNKQPEKPNRRSQSSVYLTRIFPSSSGARLQGRARQSPTHPSLGCLLPWGGGELAGGDVCLAEEDAGGQSSPPQPPNPRLVLRGDLPPCQMPSPKLTTVPRRQTPRNSHRLNTVPGDPRRCRVPCRWNSTHYPFSGYQLSLEPCIIPSSARNTQRPHSPDPCCA